MLQEAPDRIVALEADRELVRFAGLRNRAAPSQQRSTRSPVRLIAPEPLVGVGQRRERSFGAQRLADRKRAIDRDDRRARQRKQRVVERDDGRPVRLSAAAARDVRGLYGRFELVASDCPERSRASQQSLGFLDHRDLPRGRILRIEWHELA